ncbi:alpha/beta hydrolase [Larkinella soli]|uniref:alpha/beta hydrolase n=1 Tax=Larkinella soli TaxID=1770527 RepID=UPI000FFC4DC0|nr:dienelactone hydrolase family protein [Larkinella soli]
MKPYFPIRRRSYLPSGMALAWLLLALAGTARSQTVPHAPLQLAGYHYREIIENADSSARNLPVVIALHWMGASPTSFARYVTGFSRPVRLLLVEAPYPYKQGYTFYSLSPKNYYDLPADEKMVILLKEGERLSRFIEAATKKNAPATKPVILGASQGGDLSYVVATRYGHLISRACPLLATMDNRIVTQAGKAGPTSPPIDAFHGTADPIVPIETARRHVQTLKERGFQARLHTYEGVKHDIPDAMKADFIQLITGHLANP